MEVQFRYRVSETAFVEVTASESFAGTLEIGFTTPQSDDPVAILSRIAIEIERIRDIAWELMAERERANQALNIGVSGERQAG